MIAPNRDGGQPASLGVGQEVLLTWDPAAHVRRGQRRMPDREDIERALERCCSTERGMSRRQFLGRQALPALGLTALGSALPGCRSRA